MLRLGTFLAVSGSVLVGVVEAQQRWTRHANACIAGMNKGPNDGGAGNYWSPAGVESCKAICEADPVCLGFEIFAHDGSPATYNAWDKVSSDATIGCSISLGNSQALMDACTSSASTYYDLWVRIEGQNPRFLVLFPFKEKACGFLVLVVQLLL